MIDSLFEMLDVNKDGAISRSDLQTAAKRMRWHWDEAPIFALLDLLTVPFQQCTHIFLETRHRACDKMAAQGPTLFDQDHRVASRSSPEYHHSLW